MTGRWEAWFRLLPVWLPAVLLAIAGVVLYWWQTSDSTGTGARLRSQMEKLEEGLDHLARTRDLALAQQDGVRDLSVKLKALSEQSFGGSDERVISIMREVGAATRAAGLLPASFGYTTAPDKRLPFTRFSISFFIEGQYSQVRQLLAALQSSPELLIVDKLTLAGETEVASKDLRVSVGLTTYLSQADTGQTDRLTQLIEEEVAAAEALAARQAEAEADRDGDEATGRTSEQTPDQDARMDEEQQSATEGEEGEDG